MKKIFTILSFIFATSNVFAQQLTQANFTCNIVPQVMASGTSSRLPVVYRATITGLTPNTIYRYYSNLATRSASNGGTADFGSTNSGAGNSLFLNSAATNFVYTTSASLATAGGYDSLTTDNNGSFTGWFGVVNTGNGRFTAGNYVYPTIVLDSAGSKRGVVTYRFAATDSIQVLAFGTTSGTNNGTGIRGTSLATPKNLVLLYDNVSGTGKPLAIAVVESIGVTIANIASFYSANVQGTQGAWGTIVPNILSNGVRRIEQRSLVDGSLVGTSTSVDGTWPTGSVNTTNPTGGSTTPLVISATDLAALPVNLTSFTASLINNQPQVNWETSNETNFDYFGVEKSFDAKNFAEIARVASNKASNGSTYQYADINKTLSTQFYRLRMVDNDGTFKYSSVVAVNAKSTISLALYPNPVTNTIILSHPKAVAGAAVKVTGIDGKILATQNVQTGATQTSIDATRLVKGNYVVSFVNDGVASTIQITKQ